MMDKTPVLKAICLVLSILFFLGFVSLQAFAAEEDVKYQDTGFVDGLGGEEIPPGGSDSESVPGDFPDGDIPAEDLTVFFDNIAAIRRDTELLTYFVIPCSCAVLAVYKFYKWFYSTFIESVL